MRIAKALMIAGALAFAPGASAQQAIDLSGVWQGAFWGADGAGTGFQVTFDDGQPGGDFVGSSAEPNTFGDNSTRFLQATLQGNVRNGQFAMLKTYDGAGGVSHAVTYAGQVVSDRRIVGTWTLPGATGQFEIVR
ncbi:hypothetical protein U91I_03405 [alpha proteobacterium U9-1i]|nr:hypothetical protein U91I_03405 [alpha proteobacterium U9-1i]